MSLSNELEAAKAHYLKRERDILARCEKEVAEAGREKLKYTQKLSELDQLTNAMDYDGLRRVLSIREDTLNLLGFKVIQGKVQL
jgi:hypothetical protein